MQTKHWTPILTLLLMAILIISVQAQDFDIEGEILFDDFNYSAHDDPQLTENGWIVRSGDGWPGVPDAVWREENVSFVDDPDMEDNRLMQFISLTDGTDTYQTQICHQRKYYEGTYASRVYFTNEPLSGEDGDSIVQTFYLISPQEYDLDPDYSELDIEYLPNGGWGFRDHVFFMTSWETFRLDPWLADNTSVIDEGDYSGWHTIVIQVMDDEITYFVDGEEAGTHDEYFYPEVPMSINFNLWFVNGSLIDSDETREYMERMDWVFFINNTALDPDDVDEYVAQFRDDEIRFMDTVPEWEPPLESPCNF